MVNITRPGGWKWNYLEAINHRRSVRDFAKTDIPFEVIKKSLEAGLIAPSYNHLKQWDFVLVKDQTIRLALTCR